MVGDFSIGATVRGFTDAFAGFNLLLRWHGNGEGFMSRELDGCERWSGGREKMSGGWAGEIWENVVGFGVVRMTGGAHTRNPTLLEALARLIRALSVGADTGLPALLLGSKSDRCFLGHAGVAQIKTSTPIKLLGSLLGPPVEMLFGTSTHERDLLPCHCLRIYLRADLELFLL
jgi:hypothetical protein